MYFTILSPPHHNGDNARIFLCEQAIGIYLGHGHYSQCPDKGCANLHTHVFHEDIEAIGLVSYSRSPFEVCEGARKSLDARHRLAVEILDRASTLHDSTDGTIANNPYVSLCIPVIIDYLVHATLEVLPLGVKEAKIRNLTGRIRCVELQCIFRDGHFFSPSIISRMNPFVSSLLALALSLFAKLASNSRVRY